MEDDDAWYRTGSWGGAPPGVGMQWLDSSTAVPCMEEEMLIAQGVWPVPPNFGQPRAEGEGGVVLAPVGADGLTTMSYGAGVTAQPSTPIDASMQLPTQEDLADLLAFPDPDLLPAQAPPAREEPVAADSPAADSPVTHASSPLPDGGGGGPSPPTTVASSPVLYPRGRGLCLPAPTWRMRRATMTVGARPVLAVQLRLIDGQMYNATALDRDLTTLVRRGVATPAPVARALLCSLLAEPHLRLGEQRVPTNLLRGPAERDDAGIVAHYGLSETDATRLAEFFSRFAALPMATAPPVVTTVGGRVVIVDGHMRAHKFLLTHPAYDYMDTYHIALDHLAPYAFGLR